MTVEPSRPDPSAIARRRVLLGLGFGAANVAALRHLGAGVDAGGPTLVAGESAEAAATASGATATASAAATTTEIPVVDPADEITDPDHLFDTVITGGRVMDPATGFDAVATVAVADGRVRAVVLGEGPQRRGSTTIDAAGLVVAPGFIDLLSYTPNGYGEWAKIADGVTTNLGMHGLDDRAASWFADRADGAFPVHFGGAYDNAVVRPALGYDPFDETSGPGVAEIVAAAEQDLLDGFIGLHMQPEYTPGATREEVLAHGRLAARFDVPLCVHARYSDNVEPGTNLDAIDELVAVARDTGAAVHVEHITSTGGTGVMAEALARLEAGIAEGLRLTACLYPYDFWATYLQSARYEDWQEKYGISYGDLQVAGSDERLTEATYEAALAENLLTAAYAIPPGDIEAALRADFTMIGSDAILERSHNNHPRATGCFARVLGRYVRELGVVDLMTALSKMTIQPARLLERGAPALTRKGRLGIGADADLTVFDPATVADRATLADPSLRSVGFSWVLVDGRAVLTPGGVDETVSAGRAIRSELGTA